MSDAESGIQFQKIAFDDVGRALYRMLQPGDKEIVFTARWV